MRQAVRRRLCLAGRRGLSLEDQTVEYSTQIPARKALQSSDARRVPVVSVRWPSRPSAVDAGDLLGAVALHFAEIALAADPAHRTALEASLAAHRQLLEASVNFWESAWLKKEVTKLEASLADGA